jgi:hypothetical protein
MAKTIIQCPPEVLVAITAFSSSSNLYNLCLTSWYLRSVAEIHLYRTIQWTWNGNEKSFTLLPLLRSILSRPTLGGYVREITAKGDGAQSNLPIARLQNDKLHLDQVKALIKPLQLKWGEAWI